MIYCALCAVYKHRVYYILYIVYIKLSSLNRKRYSVKDKFISGTISLPTLFINHFKNSLAGRSAAGDGIKVGALLLLMGFVFSSHGIFQIFERKIFWLVRQCEKNAPLITSVHKMS